MRAISFTFDKNNNPKEKSMRIQMIYLGSNTRVILSHIQYYYPWQNHIKWDENEPISYYIRIYFVNGNYLDICYNQDQEQQYAELKFLDSKFNS